MSNFSNTDLNKYQTQFDEIVTASRSNILELKSIYGLSSLRDVVTTTASGTATGTNGNSELVLATTVGTTDVVKLSSAERGRYIPGYIGEAGIGVRLPSPTVGTQSIKWGYFDSNNGYYYEQVGGVNYISSISNGVESFKVAQSSWNVDKMDGTGASGKTLDLTAGNIFNIKFAWYGYGTIEFAILIKSNSSAIPRLVTVHRAFVSGSTSIQNPNLPISAEINNNAQANALTMYVAGRQFSIVGDYSPNRRINAQYKINQAAVSTTFVPLISFKKKTAYVKTSVKLASIEIISDANLIIQIRSGATLTGASYITPTNVTASETACQADISATAYTGGELIYSKLVTGDNKGTTLSFSSADELFFDLIEEVPVTIIARVVSGAAATVTSMVKWKEEW
jgi:hypothetical protein